MTTASVVRFVTLPFHNAKLLQRISLRIPRNIRVSRVWLRTTRSQEQSWQISVRDPPVSACIASVQHVLGVPFGHAVYVCHLLHVYIIPYDA